MLGGLSTGTKAQIGMGLLGVAMAAYEHFTKQSEVTVGTTPSTPTPPSGAPAPVIPPMPRSSKSASVETPHDPERAKDAMLLVQAMVAAAAADGVIDDEERAQMLRRATDAGFNDETKAFLVEELTRPASLAVIVSRTRPDLASDVYAASCAAITMDTDAERVYLESLAKNLGLSAEAAADIRQKLGVA
jgi:uncharacterized membrane protein YebE (DUF533 family)